MRNSEPSLSYMLFNQESGISANVELYDLTMGHRLVITILCSCGQTHGDPIEVGIPPLPEGAIEEFVTSVVEGVVGLLAEAPNQPGDDIDGIGDPI